MNYSPPIWSDDNRFLQTGYSAPTIFPKIENYQNKDLFYVDHALAQTREESHLDWLDDERYEARSNGER